MRYLTIIFTLLFFKALSQCPPGLDGIVYLDTQKDIDNFKIDYPNCKILNDYLYIYGDPLKPMTNFNGLSILEEINGSLRFDNVDNIGIVDLKGFSNLKIIRGDLSISGNYYLKSIQGLNGLDSIYGDFIIENNPISTLNGLESLKYIEGNFTIEVDSYALLNLDGLDSLNYIGKSLSLKSKNIENINGLNNLKHVGSINITNINRLKSLSGLENLTFVEKNIILTNNILLDDISSLQNLNTSELEYLEIKLSPALTNCNYSPICDYINNSLNSSNIISNGLGCSNVEEVKSSCNLIDGLDMNLSNDIFIFPSPALNHITISIPNHTNSTFSLDIFDYSGKEQISVTFKKEETIDLSLFESGFYIARIMTNDKIYYKKFQVEK